MTESTFAEHALIEQLLDSLQALPEMHAELTYVRTAGRANAKIDLRLADRSMVLLIEAKKSVYPRYVRQALWQLKSPQQAIARTALCRSPDSSLAKATNRRNVKPGYYANGKPAT